MDLRAVLFDLDGTLCQPRCPPDQLIAEAFERANIDSYCTAADLMNVESDVLTADIDDELDYYTQCFEAAAQQRDVPLDDAVAVAQAYAAIGGHSDVELLPGAATVLDDLHDQYALGLVTNGLQEIQQAKVNTLDIADMFDTLIFATPEIGLKPDPQPFKQALQNLGVASENTVHVGNSRITDVGGAHAADIHSVLIPQSSTADNGPRPDCLLGSLQDLSAAVK